MQTTTIVTHDGSFHPDDVFAVAALKMLFAPASVKRTRQSDVIAGARVVADVGGVYDAGRLRFDHHQIGGAGGRPNGIPYASFGLVWKHFGSKLAGSDAVAVAIDKDLVQYIDAMDSGAGESKPVAGSVYPYTLADVIFAMAPTWTESAGLMDARFIEAVDFAKGVLLRQIKRSADGVTGRQKVEEAYNNTEDKRIMVIDRNYPWHEALAHHPEPLFVVEPAEEGAPYWRVRTVRDSVHSFVNRQDLPLQWAGKRDKDLARITGVADAVFCHNNRFIAVAKSKDGAIQLAHLALTAE